MDDSDDFESNYIEPGEDDGMSEDEEDYLDKIMTEELSDSEDIDYLPIIEDIESSQSTEGTMSQEPLAEGVYWKDQNDEDTIRLDPRNFKFKPSRVPGLQLGRMTSKMRESLKEPIDFFRLFLTTNLVTTLCIATNENAKMLIRKGQFKSYATDGEWLMVDVEEMCKFIGIVIYMSIVKLPSLERYWSQSVIYGQSIIPEYMTKKRFQAILAFRQITPPIDVDKEDKLTRVRPLLDHVNSVSQDLFQPYEDISVDERIVASRHKFSGIRQFIKEKPIRFGLKLWVLADTKSGYTYNFFVYLGKKRTHLLNKTKGLAYSVVQQLISPLLNQGYRLFVDSFYTSLQLALDLFQSSTYLIGSVRKNSTAMPRCFKETSEKWEKVAKRGDYRWHREGNFVAVQWKDCKTVTIISPLHKGSDITTCTRTVQERTGFKSKKINQPAIVHSYNQGMNGVDKSNQNLTQYPCYIKTKFHWWKVLFFHSIDIMIVNSFVLFRLFFTLDDRYGQLNFREAIVSSLLFEAKGKKQDTKCIPVWTEKRINCVLCHSEAKLINMPIPGTKTHIQCSHCDVGLCLNKDRNCFSLWHTEDSKKERMWHKSNSRKRKLHEENS